MKIASAQLQWFYKNIESFQLWTDHNFWISIMLWVTYILITMNSLGTERKEFHSEITNWDLEKGPAFYICAWIFLAHSEAETTMLVTHHLKSHNISSMHTNCSHPELDLESESVLMACYAQHLMIHSWRWLKATESKMTLVCVHRILQRWLL